MVFGFCAEHTVFKGHWGGGRCQSLLFKAAPYSVVCTDQVLSVHLSLDGHMGGFHLRLLRIVLQEQTRTRGALAVPPGDPGFASRGASIRCPVVEAVPALRRQSASCQRRHWV